MVQMKAYRVVLRIMMLMAFAINIISCNKFSAGSYSGSQEYEVNMSSTELIRRVIQIKNDNPHLNVWTENEEGKLYNIDHKSGDYYSFYFKLPINGNTVIALTVIDERESYPAIIMLNSITYSQNLGGFIKIDSKKLSREERKNIEFVFKKNVIEKIMND